MAIHVWSEDGDYLGLIGKGGHTLGISPESDEMRKALDTILAHPPMSDTGGFEIRFGSKPVRFLEFPNEDWLDVAALLFLPPAGFRVHVITGPERERRF